MSKEITNEDIRERLLELNYDCGPVTDTTREIHLKKLKFLETDSGKECTRITDEELRSELMGLGFSVAPITSTNRRIYVERLRKLKESKKEPRKEPKSEYEECEPMDVD